jgi:hypothetical protein
MNVPKEQFSTPSGNQNRDAIVASLPRFFLDLVIVSVSLAVSTRHRGWLISLGKASLLLSSMRTC